MSKQYAVIIDTDQYSGNFERELCAYITGQYGECEVGKETAENVAEELGKSLEWFEDNIIHNTDEKGCSRPVSIEPTPGFFNNGCGKSFLDDTNIDIVKAATIKSVHNYYDKHIKMAEEHIKNGKHQWEKDLCGYKKRISEVENKAPNKYPAYQSIIMFFYSEPPKHIMELIKERANKANKNIDLYGRKPFNILNVRFISRKTIIIDEAI